MIDAVECLQDVVSHYRSFRSALECKKASFPETNDDGGDERSYWQHEINVLDRMHEQAANAVRAMPRDYRKELAEAMGMPDGVRAGLAWSLLLSYVQDWRRSITDMEAQQDTAEALFDHVKAKLDSLDEEIRHVVHNGRPHYQSPDEIRKQIEHAVRDGFGLNQQKPAPKPTATHEERKVLSVVFEGDLFGVTFDSDVTKYYPSKEGGYISGPVQHEGLSVSIAEFPALGTLPVSKIIGSTVVVTSDPDDFALSITMKEPA